MLNRLESIKNKIMTKFPKERTLHLWQKKCEFCKKTYGFFYKVIDVTAKRINKFGVSANVVTIIGFIIGLLAINFLSLEKYGLALLCILLNRLFDALDGAIARNSKVTDFGIFLDAALDYIFYAGVIFGFALANPAQNAIAACFLLFAFASAACSMLAYGVIAYKNNTEQKAIISQSPFYLGGIAQGFETLIALVVLCIIPSMFLQIAIVLGILSLIKALSVITAAYYNFVIAKRK